MSFFFPSRTFKRLSDLNIVSFQQKVSTAKETYTEHVASYLGLGWVLSFIPKTKAFEARKKFAEEVNSFAETVSQKIQKKEQVTIRYPNNNTATVEKNKYPTFDRFLLRTNGFPSWLKVIFLALFTALMVGIALTGVGALAQLGVFGGTVAGLAITKIAATAFALGLAKLATLTGTLSISPLIAAAVTTAVSAFLANLSLFEIVKPGYFTRFLIGKQNDDLPSGTNLTRSVKKSLPEIIGSAITEGKKDLFEKNDDMGFRYAIRYLLNPARLAVGLVEFLKLSSFKLIDTGTKEGPSSALRRLVKWPINLAAEIVTLPLKTAVLVLDVPFYALTGVVGFMGAAGSAFAKLVAGCRRPSGVRSNSNRGNSKQRNQYYPVDFTSRHNNNENNNNNNNNPQPRRNPDNNNNSATDTSGNTAKDAFTTTTSGSLFPPVVTPLSSTGAANSEEQPKSPGLSTVTSN